MANIEFPSNGFVKSVDAGEEATVEPLKIDYNFLNAKFDNDPLLGGHTHDGTAGNAPKIGLSGLTQEVINNMGGFPNCQSKGVSYAMTTGEHGDCSLLYRIEVDGNVGMTISIAPNEQGITDKQLISVPLCLKALTSLKVYVFPTEYLLLNLTGETYLFSINFTRQRNPDNYFKTDMTATANYGIPF